MPASGYLVEGPLPASWFSLELSGRRIRTAAGAHAFFAGQVRDDEVDGKRVAGIEYSSYDAMVEPVIQNIIDQLFAEFPDLLTIDIRHSTGLVRCGEISLGIMVSSGHRKESFAALEKCVELIKKDLPVWKKELFTDGTCRWI